jgi:hypothetical protein
MGEIEIKSSEDSESSDTRTEAMVAAIITLIDGLSPSDRERVLQRLTERLRPIPVPRAGGVLGVVVQLIPRDRDWTVKEIKQRAEEAGELMGEKALYNALGYLTRRQHIKRIGQGRYVINGMAIVTGDEIGGQPTITGGDLDD